MISKSLLPKTRDFSHLRTGMSLCQATLALRVDLVRDLFQVI
jgi:hypothetical protein